ncbi:MAG TPA: hypothetical protein VFW68_05175 [Rhodocyclaceae bacterium]|nr:hypothetical protein [Rhodocyclaceae bacterium]
MSSKTLAPADNTATNSDPLRLLAPLRRTLVRANADSSELPRTLASQLGTLEQALIEVLLSSVAPLPPAVRVLVRGMDDLYSLWLENLTRTDQPRAALTVLYQRLLIALVSHSLPPQDIWLQAIALHRRAEDGGTLGAALALSTIQAGSYTPRQLWNLGLALLAYGKQVQLRDKPPESPQGWLWLDGSGRPAGTAARALSTLSTDQLLYFNCAELARRLDKDATQIEQGESVDWLDQAIPSSEIAGALRLAAGHWLAPLHRRHSRRRQSSPIQVCTRLDQVWSVLDAGQAPSETSDWLLLNESASGCALMHSTGAAGNLTAGQALGLRHPGMPWTVGIVRWTRSDNSAHLELGVEVLSSLVRPVRIAAEGQSPEPAFLLPARPGEDLGEALLSTAKPLPPNDTAGEFVLLAEKDGQLRISKCRRGEPRHKTARIEIFSFERLTRDA